MKFTYMIKYFAKFLLYNSYVMLLLSYNRNDKICQNYSIGKCSDVKCPYIHPNEKAYMSDLHSMFVSSTNLLPPLVDIILNCLGSLTLTAMRIAHENKTRVVMAHHSHPNFQYVWNDIVCTAWFRCDLRHTTNTYYGDCGLLHAQLDDEKAVDKILSSIKFNHLTNDAEKALIKKRVLMEGGSNFKKEYTIF